MPSNLEDLTITLVILKYEADDGIKHVTNS